MEFAELYEKARAVLNPRRLSDCAEVLAADGVIVTLRNLLRYDWRSPA